MDSILVKIAAYLARQSNSDKDQEEIILYGLQLVYSAIGGFIAIVILAQLTGVLISALIAALSSAILRVKAGGAHATFPASCFTLGAVFFTLIGLIVDHTSPLLLFEFIILMTIVSYFFTRRVLLKYAPAETPEKPLGEERKQNLRLETFKIHKIQFLILFVLEIYILLGLPFSKYIIVNYLLAALLGILWETFTVSPWGYKFIGLLDKIMKSLFSLLRLNKNISHINN